MLLADDTPAHRAGGNGLVQYAPALRQTVTGGGRQPQPEQQAFLRRIIVVAEIGARMQRDMAVDDLQIARLQPHRVREIGTAHQRVKRLQRIPLFFRQLRHALDLLRRGHAVAVPFAEQPAVHRIKNRMRIGRRLVRRLFALAAEMNRLMQQFGEIRMFTLHRLIRRHRTGGDAHAALGRFVVAAQRDDVGGIGMKIELGVRVVAATGAGSISVAGITHRRDVVALFTLRPANAEMQADAPGQQFEVLFIQTLARQAAHQRDAAPALHLGEGCGEHWIGAAEIKVVATIIKMRFVTVQRPGQRGDQIAARALIQREQPAPVGIEFGRGPCGGRVI